MTKDQYVLKLKLLTSDTLEVLTEQENVSVEQMQINTTVKAEELEKMALQINNEVANAFVHSRGCILMAISQKNTDATNEFITYAVSPVAEVINDTLTAYVVGEDDYCSKNEKVMVWLARFKHVDVVDKCSKS